MRVHVTETLGDLVSDLRKSPAIVKRQGAKVVRKNVRAGWSEARKMSRARSGPHGKFLYKRITEEMTGPLEGEYGYEREEFVGGGFRNAPPNRDMPDSADIVGPKFADDARGVLDKVFWP